MSLECTPTRNLKSKPLQMCSSWTPACPKPKVTIAQENNGIFYQEDTHVATMVFEYRVRTENPYTEEAKFDSDHLQCMGEQHILPDPQISVWAMVMTTP